MTLKHKTALIKIANLLLEFTNKIEKRRLEEAKIESSKNKKDFENKNYAEKNGLEYIGELCGCPCFIKTKQ